MVAAKWLILVLVPLLLLFGFSAIMAHVLGGEPPDENYPAWLGAAQIVYFWLVVFFMYNAIKWLHRVLFPEKRGD